MFSIFCLFLASRTLFLDKSIHHVLFTSDLYIGNRRRNIRMKTHFIFLSTIYILVATLPECLSYLRYTDQSCTDLTPRSYDEFTNTEDTFSSMRRWPVRKRKRDNFGEGGPFKITTTGRRYRRDTDFIVNIEGGAFDGLIVQARAFPGNSDISHGNVVGIVGQFRFLRFPFKYLTCFDIPYATVVDIGQPLKLGNISFVWRAPEQDAGDVRFVTSISRGINYWIIASNTLTFNPFPISSYSCGSTIACFRICSYGQSACSPRDALYSFTYYADFHEKREIEFTIGGRIKNNNSYIAVAFGDDFENLSQADLVVCYLDHGVARIEHLVIENLFLPPFIHNEPIEVEDYDLDGNMLWCRYRRPISPPTIINARQTFYHFHFWGSMDHYMQRFILPRRQQIYASAFKRNFSAAYNEIISKASVTSQNIFIVFLVSILGIMYGSEIF